MHVVFLRAILLASSSSSRQVSSVASSLLEDFLNDTPVASIIPHIAAIAMHEKDRLRTTAYKAINRQMPRYVSENLTETKKNIFPALCAPLLSSTKPEIRTAACEAMRTLNNLCINDPEFVSMNKGGVSDISSWATDLSHQLEVRKVLGVSR